MTSIGTPAMVAEPRSENLRESIPAPTPPPPPQQHPPPPPPASASPAAPQTVVMGESMSSPSIGPTTALGAGMGPVKKKRGRPRKYGPDGSVVSPRLAPLSPMPISASMPAGEFPAASAAPAAMKQRGRGRPGGLASSKHQRPRIEFEGLGKFFSFSFN